MDLFVSQPWYAMVGEMVVMANMITMFVHKHWAKDNEFLSTVMTMLDWVALNIFKNKNAEDAPDK